MSKFPWLESYPDFVSHSTEINYENIVEIYNQSIRNFGDKVAYKNMDVELTYNELDNHVNALIYYFQNNTNLKKGDKIVLQMPNLLQYPVAIFACLKAGLVIVNTNPLYTADEMLHQYKDSGAKAVIIVENFAHNLEKIVSETDIETVIITTIGDLLGGFKGGLVNFVIRNVKKMVPAFSIPGSLNLKKILKDKSGKKGKNVEIKNTDTGAFFPIKSGSSLNNEVKSLKLNDPNMNAVVIVNIDVNPQDKTLDFQHDGWWYEYFSGDSIQINGTSIISLDPGEYKVYTDLKLDKPEILNTLGLNEYEVANWDVNIFPNPSRDFLNITVHGSQSKEIKYTIMNTLGKIIYQQSGTIKRHQINIEKLSNGNYFLILEQDNYLTSKEFIKF